MLTGTRKYITEKNQLTFANKTQGREVQTQMVFAI